LNQRLLLLSWGIIFTVPAIADSAAEFNREMAKQIDHANDLLAAGNVEGARRMLNKIDARDGGLTAPRSVDLAARIDAMN